MSAHENPFPPYDPDARSRAAARLAADPATPPGAEARLESYRDELDEATEALTATRNTELDAEEARDKALRDAQLSDDCPIAGVIDGRRTTVAYVKAWIEDQAADDERAYRQAKVARQAATAHLSKLREQGRFQQSITASARESYRGTNGRNW